MKNLLRKIGTMLTAICLVFGMATPAFAATTGSSDNGSITVSGLESGVTASAYQIAEADYDSDGNFTGYKMSVTTTGWSIGADGSYSDPTEEDLAALWKLVSGSTAAGSAQANADGTATISGLPVGSYLIVISGSESTVYSMMIGSVSYDTEGGEWVVSGGSVNVTGDNLWVKSTKPTVDKEEVTEDGDSHGDSAVPGDEITFHITVDNIPHYDGDYPEFEVHDVLTGLEITNDEISELTVTVNGDTVLKEGTDYTVTKTDDGFVVNFVVNNSYTLNDYAGGSLVIAYSATVIEVEADENGVADHSNSASLTFSTNSYLADSENGDGGDDDGGTDTSHEYSFSASMTKIASDTTSGLSGATFAIYDEEGTEISTATSGSNGVFTFSNLREGTYTVKEKEAPAGYLLSQAVYTVNITADYNTDGTIKEWDITVTDENGDPVGSSKDTSTTDARITNTRTGGLLPSMGGRGTLIFALIGCGVIACVAVAVSRRKPENAA